MKGKRFAGFIVAVLSLVLVLQWTGEAVSLERLTVTGELSDIKEGAPYFCKLKVEGGVAPYTWDTKIEKLLGKFVSGLTFTVSDDAASGDTLIISGTPTLTRSLKKPIRYALTFLVTDSGRSRYNGKQVINISGYYTGWFTGLGFNALTGKRYDVPVKWYGEIGGVPPYKLALAEGTLPPGMSFVQSGDSYAVSGTPTTTGEYTYTIRLTDSNDVPLDRNFTTKVYPGDKVTILNDASFESDGRAGRSYYSTISVIGHSPYTYSVTSGAVPPGLELSTSETLFYDDEEAEEAGEQERRFTLSGRPEQEGKYSFTLRIIDNAGLYTEKTFSFEFGPKPDGVAINADNFPDERFRNLVMDEIAYEDGVLTPEIIAELTEMEIGGEEITNIKGIEYFVALERLTINSTGFKELDLSILKPLTVLKALYINGNTNLSSLNLGENTSLISLHCPENSLTSLDISGCPNLAYLDCSQNKLTKLDLRMNPKLIGLRCDNNQLGSLIVYKCPLLGSEDMAEIYADYDVEPGLSCVENKLTELNISGCPALFFVEEEEIEYDYDEEEEYDEGYYSEESFYEEYYGEKPNFEIDFTKDSRGRIVKFRVPEFNNIDFDETTFIKWKAGIPVAITTDSLPYVKTGTSFSFQLEADGSEPVTWEKVSGNLPAGMSLSESGIISGTATKTGSYSFTVKASNAETSDEKAFTLIVYTPIEIATSSLKDGVTGKNYSAQLKLKKNDKSAKWSVEGLPDGLTMTEKGKISGKPSAYGTFSLVISVNNGGEPATKTISLTIKAIAPKLSGSLKKAELGESYSSGLKLTQGTLPVTWELEGSLPDGLSFDESTGQIYGTPLELWNDTVIITAENPGGTVSKTLKLSVKGKKPSITAKLKQGQVDVPYEAELTAKGSNPITWSVSGLPSGLSFSGNKISGTPAEAGKKFKVSVTASNAAGEKTKVYTLKIIAAKTAKKELPSLDIPTAYSSVPGVNGVNEAPGQEDTDNAGGFVIAAELGVISCDEAGMYEFDATLSDNAPEGWKLVYMAGSDNPSDDDDIAEFYGETGEEISAVPESRSITVSIWLNPGTVYEPKILVISGK